MTRAPQLVREALCLCTAPARKSALQVHQILRHEIYATPAGLRGSVYCSCHEICAPGSPSAAPATKSMRQAYCATLLFAKNAMESCKTNRRTGVVGSPSELVGGRYPNHVLSLSRSCCDGPVIVSRSYCDGVPVMLRWCPGHVVMVSSWCPGYAATVSRSCCDGVPVML